jgi:hypothetical protein
MELYGYGLPRDTVQYPCSKWTNHLHQTPQSQTWGEVVQNNYSTTALEEWELNKIYGNKNRPTHTVGKNSGRRPVV